MKSFREALEEGYAEKQDGFSHYYSFKFGDKEEYELCFEPLLFDDQFYVALYKDKFLLTEKVVIKPGKE